MNIFCKLIKFYSLLQCITIGIKAFINKDKVIFKDPQINIICSEYFFPLCIFMHVSTTFKKVFPDAWLWFIGCSKNKFIYKKLQCKYKKEDVPGNAFKMNIYFDL